MKVDLPLKIEIPQTPGEFKTGLMFRESLDMDSGMLFVFDRVTQQSFHMSHTTIPLDIAFIDEEGCIESIKELTPLRREPVYSNAPVLYALEVNRGWFAENEVKVGDQIIKDEINENIDTSNWRDDFKPTEYEFTDIITPEPLQSPKNHIKWVDLGEATNLPRKTGNILTIYLGWRGKSYSIQMFFPSVKVPSRREVQDQLQKIYPGAKLWSYQVSEYDQGEPLVQAGGR
jgi:uncharacterized membrane protein (UPF0127 family)